MRRTLAALAAIALAALLVVLPAGATPAQAVDTVRSFGCISTIDPRCAGKNAPILAEAGLMSAGGSTAATGGMAVVAGTGAAGSLGFTSVLGATGAAVGVGLLKLYGVDEGLYIETDPDYVDPVMPSGGYLGESCFSDGLCVKVAKMGKPSTEFVTCLMPTTAVAFGSGNRQLNLIEYTRSGGQANFANSLVTLYNPAATYTGPFATMKTFCAPYPWVYINNSTVNGVASIRATASGLPVPVTPAPAGYHGQIRTTVECIAPGWSSPSFESRTERVDVEPGDRIPVPALHCTAPAIAKSAKIEYKPDGSTEWIELGSGDASATVTGLVDEYPSCFSSTGMTLCELQLERFDGVRWESCGELAEFCPTWVREWSETPDLYRCKFGSYDVSMDRCSAFRKPGTLLPNHETDGSGTPQPIPPTAPVPNPSQYPNPVQDPQGNPLPDFGSIIDTSGEPTPSEQAGQCFPTGWGILNPVSWVLMPVQCALRWAFVPRAAIVTARFAQMEADASGTWLAAPIMVINSITGAFDVGALSCQGPPLHLHIEFPGQTTAVVDETYYPMSACEEPMLGVASAINGMIAFTVIALTGLSIVRYFMTLIGYAPFGAPGDGVKFVDSRTGEVLD